MKNIKLGASRGQWLCEGCREDALGVIFIFRVQTRYEQGRK